MFLPPSFLDTLRDKIPLSTLIGKKVKLTRRGHEYTGLCPFHKEKTASFTINDEKGFYHCFGCGAHGDIFTYLVEAEKMPFMEAVEHLASMAGVKMPEVSPDQKRMESERTGMTAIMEEACRFFQNQLFGLGGVRAKNYLIKRGISGNVAKQFRLGYAPNGSALTQHLEAKGFDLKQCQKLGLVAKSQDGTRFHDYFYDRVMFPILDRRKRVIGFGGRMMEKGEPKYLNSPETALFHKGEQLYALPHAIDTIRKENRAILVEGYMDVIALHSAGFTGAVAPLGTALTENQIKILWQSCDEPLICFDGDGAGRKASLRALYRALPILTAGKSLRFVSLPDPYDPDDMIRKKSPEAFRQVLAESQTLADLLWQDLRATYPVDTPERQALFEKKVNETISKIQDAGVRAYYQNDFKNRIWRLFHTKNKTHKPPKTQPIHTPVQGVQDIRMMLAYVISYPEIGEAFLDDLSAIRIPDKSLKTLLGDISVLMTEQADITPDELKEALGENTISDLKLELEMVQKSAKTDDEVRHILSCMMTESKRKILEAEIHEKTDSYFKNPSPEVWESIKVLKKEIEKLCESE
ncbi:MAG: DNA primase [Alphaproteobacteria bacterium]|nr:DNA primase [Alphaproteobacteria bacterium]